MTFDPEECARLIAIVRSEAMEDDDVDTEALANQLEAAMAEVERLDDKVTNYSLILDGTAPYGGWPLGEELSAAKKDRDALRTELGTLQDVLGHLRGISDLDSRPCELCVYAGGVFVRRCSMHAAIDGLRAEIAILTEERDHALGHGVLSQRVCDLENENAHLRSAAGSSALAAVDAYRAANVRDVHEGCVYNQGMKCRGNDRCQFPLQCVREK